ncbi:MAG: hypothetical protein ACRDYX_21000 [Egibacteraceae bacterium]
MGSGSLLVVAVVAFAFVALVLFFCRKARPRKPEDLQYVVPVLGEAERVSTVRRAQVEPATG